MSLIWLVVLVGGGYLVYRWATGDGSIGTDPALEELRMAYARGDVTEEEYERRRSKLERE
jgi:putative membrane protein